MNSNSIKFNARSINEGGDMFRKSMIVMLILTMLLSFSAFAEDETWLETQETEDIFNDVNKEDWFYESVMTMHRYGIIAGVGENMFKPDNAVLREEFASMMVKALQLDIVDSKSSFVDVADGYWASKVIETAKSYLTGFVKKGEYRFKPKDNAVREDMAVALVRALDKPVNEEQLKVLENYEDADQISPNLKSYVASAIANNLINDVEIEGKKYIKPMATLKRSEVAALLLSIVKEEKIVFESEEKIVLENTDLELTADLIEGGVKLSWTYKGQEEITGYKVVASKTNENPIYPEDGSAKYVQNNTTIIYNNDSYSGGDFDVFKAGETYFFSMTGLVDESFVTSNVVEIKMPQAVSLEGKVPEVEVSQVGDGVVVEWSDVDTNGLQGYKIVASLSDDTPIYPDNGYAAWVTNLNTKSFYIEPGTAYNGGDIGGKFMAGKTYHFSVTAIYKTGKIAGNTVSFIMPGEPEEEVSIEERTLKVDTEVADGKLLIKWNDINLVGLQGYKVVASRSNPTPVYPDDGYAAWITDLETRSLLVTPGTLYNGGDLEGQFKSGETYYVSVTAVYDNIRVPGIPTKVIMP